jgi:hypothetical protein
MPKKDLTPIDENEWLGEQHEIDITRAMRMDPDFAKKHLNGPNKKVVDELLKTEKKKNP